MKDCNFEAMEVDGRKETMNLSERGKTVCLNVCLIGYLMLMLKVALWGGSILARIGAIATLGVMLAVIASNNGLLGVKK